MKKIVSLALVLALCLTFFPVMASAEETANVWDGSVATGFAGGTGTEEAPYQIATGSQLAYLASQVNSGTDYKGSYFILTANIDLNNMEWTPIGNSFAGAFGPSFSSEKYLAFAGQFDGNGYTISNLVIGTAEEPTTADVFGLFGATEGVIQNLNLDTVSINGVAKNVSGHPVLVAGALVGSVGGAVKNCHVTNLSMSINNTISNYPAAYWIGGFVGFLDGNIEECSASGRIEEKSGKGSIGGFIGELAKTAKISYSKADVALNVEANGGGADVGGFIGKGNGKKNEETVVRNCYATGNVTGGSYAGGFAGGLWGLNIKNCYATGKVTQAAAAMASFVGTDASDSNYYGSVKNCYAVGEVSGTASSKYAFAMQDATERSEITNCYFEDTNSSIKNKNETATAKSLSDMQKTEFVDALNAGDSSNGWIYKEGKTPLCGAEPADYSAVDAALANIPKDLTVYTGESVAALNEATSNVIKGKVIAKQSEVDAMATAINEAISKLTYKPADYTAVDAAINKANALDKNAYKDFSAVEAAVNAVDRSKNITEQDKVDAMAKAINDAIAALEKKSSSSGSDSSRPSYSITTPSKPENGTITVNPANAKSGNTVTITVTPDSGYKLGELVVTDKDGKKLELTDKGNGQYTFTMPSGKVEVAAEFVKEVEVSPFADVATDAYYYDAVKWAVEKGVTNGVSETLFGPDQACTRAQIVTFLWRAAGSPEPKSGSSFADVAADAYYAKAVAWAVENGITKGTSETTFHPDETCTRAQGVTFLYRALGKLAAAQAGFTDVAADSYYADAVNWAAENGVTKGISETLFGPDGSCTRAQIVTFLYRAYQGK